MASPAASRRVCRGASRSDAPGRFRAAVLACDGGTALGRFSAAAEWGFIPWEEREVEVVTLGGARLVEGVRVHRSRSLDRRDIWWRRGMPVTSPARTLLDLALVLPEYDLRRAARQAQAMRLVSVPQILEITARCKGHRGAAKLLAVVADGPMPTASPLEDDLLDLLDSKSRRSSRRTATGSCGSPGSKPASTRTTLQRVRAALAATS